MTTPASRVCLRILITGARGRIGRFLVPALVDAGFEVTAVDTVTSPDADPGAHHVVADITHRETIQHLLAGHDALIHLAAHPTAQTWGEIEAANIRGAVSALEAAGENGLGKLIFTSSIHVCGYAHVEDRFDQNTPLRPDGPYGVSKVFGEAVARHVHERFGTSVFVLRVGTCRPRPLTMRERTTWISPADFVRLVLACLEPAASGYRMLWAFSTNRNANIDRSDWATIGYRPCDDADDYLSELSDPEAGTPGQGRIGGRFVKGPRSDSS